MAREINVIAVVFACATAASAVLAPFPHGKTTVYRYHTVVTTEAGDEGLLSSQFVLQGTLDITHDTRDPELLNAYNVVLSNVMTDMHNGVTVDYDGKPVLQSVDEAAGVIQRPFLIIYNTNGTFQAVKIDEFEPEWSKNMKIAMATMLQLDLPNINVKNLTNESHSFVSQEKTIHGDCSVTYNVYPKDKIYSNIPKEFGVNKTFSPMNCVGFAVHEFNNVDNEHRGVKKEQRMFIDSSRDFQMENQADGILIKKLVARGFINVLSSNGASHFVVTKTTFEFLRVDEKSETHTLLGNFVNLPIIRDVTYRKPQRSYVPNAAVDITQGRHVVNFQSIPYKLEKLLFEAINYIDGNHFDSDPDKMNWNSSRTINKILHTMSYMDADALQVTFDVVENMARPEASRIENIFLGVVSQVGTPASCTFTRNIILKNKISALAAIDMLSKLPLSVKVPTTELLAQMEILAQFSNPICAEVRKAGILSFSSLIYRTFKHVSRPEDSTILNKYLRDFLDHVKNEPTYEMKVVYLMAIRNIQVGKIYDLLEPIINGNLLISEDPEHIRLLAIWAINKAVEQDYNIAFRILSPVMMNETLSTKLRIAAYEILMNQAPDEDSALKVHQYVSSEGNEHFYNYHYTTLDSIAKSSDQSKVNIRTIVRSILKNIDYPPKSQQSIQYILSGVNSVGYIDDVFGYAEKIDIGVVVNEFTGVPEVLQFEHVVTDYDGAVSNIAIQVHIEGHREIMTELSPLSLRGLTLSALRNLLEQAAIGLPEPKKLHIDIVLMRNGRVFIANHYNFENLVKIYDDVMNLAYYQMADKYAINYLNVVFDRLYEKQLTSDIGVPVVVETRVPIVNSLNINYTVHDRPLELDLVAEFKTLKHGDYSMSVYNPMKGVWHAVRFFTADEVSLPLRTIISCGGDANTLKLSFPERPAANPPVAGFLIQGKHLVTVDEEETRALMESCDTCRHRENDHDGSQEQNSSKYIERSVDFENTGLKFSTSSYRCVYGFTTEMYLGPSPDWDNTFSSNVSNSWSDLLLQGIVYTRQGWSDNAFDLQMKSCGYVLKVEPSTNYSISHIDVNFHVKYDDLDINETTLEVLHAEKYKIYATFDVVSSLTNTTAQLWKFDADVDMNRDHLTNRASVQITRKTPEEKDLKICINAKKNYPAAPADDLKLGVTNEEINSKITVTYGYTKEEECVLNETMISMTLKAQLSDEQKKRLKHDIENSDCSKDTKNPRYASPRNLVPRTMNCWNEAIRYTTPRKYTFDVKHKELSQGVAHFLYHFFTDRREPRETGKFKFEVEFPMETNSMDYHWMTNTSDITKVNIPLKTLCQNGQGPVMNPLWDFPLDNSRFSLKYLYDYIEDDIRICSVYHGILMTGDGETVPLTIPSNEWNLISGDHVDKRFAVLVKQTRPNYLSFLVFIKDYGVHFFTRESDNVLVAMADGIKPATEEGFRLPLDESFGWTLKVTKRNDHFVVKLKHVPLTLLVGSNYISIVFDSELQGHVSGLCGHLNGRFSNGHPELYSIQVDDDAVPNLLSSID